MYGCTFTYECTAYLDRYSNLIVLFKTKSWMLQNVGN